MHYHTATCSLYFSDYQELPWERNVPSAENTKTSAYSTEWQPQQMDIDLNVRLARQSFINLMKLTESV
jgi:hypothetical protein